MTKDQTFWSKQDITKKVNKAERCEKVSGFHRFLKFSLVQNGAIWGHLSHRARHFWQCVDATAETRDLCPLRFWICH